jgi:hypothetical protein
MHYEPHARLSKWQVVECSAASLQAFGSCHGWLKFAQVVQILPPPFVWVQHTNRWQQPQFSPGRGGARFPTAGVKLGACLGAPGAVRDRPAVHSLTYTLAAMSAHLLLLRYISLLPCLC